MKLLDSIDESLKKNKLQRKRYPQIYSTSHMASKNFLVEVNKLCKNLPNAVLSCNSNGDYVKNFDTFSNLQESGLKEILITFT